MTETSFLQEHETQPRKRSEMLNVLTILTFIGCAIELYSSISGYFLAQQRYDLAIQNQQKVSADAPAIVKSLTGTDMVEVVRKSMEYKTPILIAGLIACALCVWGAFQMRSLKRKGFYAYVVGELLPQIVSIVLIGFGSIGGVFVVIGLVISLVFIGLYASQWNTMS
jgi:hypothetical protein